MPDPIEILFDPVSLGFLALYGALMRWEALAPGRNLPKVGGRMPRALGSFTLYFFLSSYLPLIRDVSAPKKKSLDSVSVGSAP